MPHGIKAGLKGAWDWANTPMIGGSEQINQIDAPALERSPLEAGIRGFGAGALEGLRGFTTPLSVASAALPIPGMGRAAGAIGRAPGAVQGLRGGAKPAFQVAETLGERLPEFAAVGGEGMYNAARQGGRAIADPLESVYQNMLRQGGRAPEGVNLPKPPTSTPFQQLQQQGAFGGDRSIRNVGNLQQEQPGGLSSVWQEYLTRGR